MDDLEDTNFKTGFRANLIRFIIISVPVSLIAALFIGLYLQDKEAEGKLAECPLFTVGKVVQYRNRGWSPSIVYKYEYQGRTYQSEPKIKQFIRESNYGYPDEKRLNRKRFWVMLTCKDPAFHKIMWEMPEPDSSIVLPISGLKLHELPAHTIKPTLTVSLSQ